MNPTPSTAFVRFAKNGTTTYSDFYTADNNLGQAAPAHVRAGTVYANGNLTGTCAVPAAGSVALGVPVDATTGTAVLTPEAVWGASTRTLTAGAGISASDVWAYNSRTLTTSSGPTAVEIRQEIDANSTKLDATVSSRLAGSAYSAPSTPPTASAIASAVWAAADKTGYSLTSAERSAIATAVESSLLNESDGQQILNAIVGAIGNSNVDQIALVAAIRADMERNGGKIDSIPTTAAPTAAQNATAVWGASAKVVTGGTVDTLTNAPASVTPSDIWSHATRTLTTSSGPTAVQIRQEIDANSTKLDAAISTRLAATESTKLDAMKAKTDALNTERLANVATTAIVGNLIAQANS